jgi:glutaredoxin
MTQDRGASLGPPEGIIIYGTDWCPDCIRARRFFDRNKVAYMWIDTDKDRLAEAFVRHSNNGKRIVPTILFPDGTILAEPSDQALAEKLELSE